MIMILNILANNKSFIKLKIQEYSLRKVEKILREVDKIALTKQYQFIDASLVRNYS